MDNETNLNAQNAKLMATDERNAVAPPTKTLSDLPKEMIEEIIGKLKLVDRLNFGVSCRRINEILNNCSKFWDDCWLNIDKLLTSNTAISSGGLNHQYVKVKWNNEKILRSSLLLSDIFNLIPTIAEATKHVKSLCLVYDGRSDLPEYSIENEMTLLTLALSLFKNLTHLEIKSVGMIQLKFPRPPANIPRNFPINLNKLEHLAIPADVMAYLVDHRFFKFSTDKLRDLQVHGYKNYHLFDLVLSQQFKNALMRLIMRQNNLEVLYLCLNDCFLFDQPLLLDSKLEKFQFLTVSPGDEDLPSIVTIDTNQQDNLVDFLESQIKLQQVRFQFKGESTTKMLKYRLTTLEMQRPNQLITICDDEVSDRLLWSNIKAPYNKVYKESISTPGFVFKFGGKTDNCFTTDELRLVERQQPQPNNSDVNLFIVLKNVPAYDEWIPILNARFPHVVHLQLHVQETSSFSLTRLQEMQRLQNLRLINCNLEKFLKDLTIPSLANFQNGYCKNTGYSLSTRRRLKAAEFNELKSFFSRHPNLTGVKLALQNEDVRVEDERYLEPENANSETAAVEFQKRAIETITLAIKHLKSLKKMEVTGLNLLKSGDLMIISKFISYYAHFEFELQLQELRKLDSVKKILKKTCGGKVEMTMEFMTKK